MLCAGQAIAQVLRFFRNVLLARMLEPADFGVASTFWITTTFLTAISHFGFEQMLIRDPDGDKENVAATGQSLLALRGLLMGIIIFFVSYPVMTLFARPDAAGAFGCLAFSSILGGLVHRDTIRFQRSMRFGPSVITQLAPDITVTFLAWPIVTWFADYRAFVAFAIIQAALSVIASHCVAERKFRLGWDREVISKYMSFGWPLLLNSILIFLVMQGDRFVLAKSYSMAELGFYSVAVGLTMTPGGVLIGIFSQLVLPTLARSQSDKAKSMQHYCVYVAATGAISAAMGTAFILAGPTFINALYGPKYTPAALLVGTLGIMQAIRLFRVPSVTFALAKGDSKNSLYENVARQFGLFLAVLAAIYEFPLIAIAISGAIGEIIATIVSLYRTNRIHGLPLRHSTITGLLVLAFFAIATCSWCLMSDASSIVMLAFSAVFSTFAAICILLNSEFWRQEIFQRLLLVSRKLTAL